MSPSARILVIAGTAAGIMFGAAHPASADPHPSIEVPAGWTQTHAGNGDVTWTRGGQQLHTKVRAFAGTIDELVRILRQGVTGDPDTVAAKVVDVPVRTCGGTQAARRVTIDTGPGERRAIANMTVAVDGANLYEASYLRLAGEPDLPEGHAAVMSLCIKRS